MKIWISKKEGLDCISAKIDFVNSPCLKKLEFEFEYELGGRFY